MGTKYTSTANSAVGYGSAARVFITSLYTVGVDVTCETIYQTHEKTNYGWTGELCKNLENRNIPYKIKIIHLTPDTGINYFEKDKYHIWHLFWEVDRLPTKWVEPLNKGGEVWTSSGTMAEVLKASGVKIPIYWFPQPIDIAEADRDHGKFEIEKHKGFMFYSIFQWIERKNPRALLKYYWETFTGRDDVSLLLKVFRLNHNKEEHDMIVRDIKQWKQEMRLNHYPRILFPTKLLTKDDMFTLHNTGDCYISTHRGEGWGRTIQEALLLGKPVISTARGGVHEYLNEEHYFPIKSKYVPVTVQNWIPYYGEQQQWAEIDKTEFINAMKFVFANRDVARVKGVKAKQFIKDEFNFQKVGLQMRKRLEQIDSRL